MDDPKSVLELDEVRAFDAKSEMMLADCARLALESAISGIANHGNAFITRRLESKPFA